MFHSPTFNEPIYKYLPIIYPATNTTTNTTTVIYNNYDNSAAGTDRPESREHPSAHNPFPCSYKIRVDCFSLAVARYCCVQVYPHGGSLVVSEQLINLQHFDIIEMDIEIGQKQRPSKKGKIQKMWHAENIKQNLSKICQMSARNTPTQSPHHHTHNLNISQNCQKEMSVLLSPRSTGINPNTTQSIQNNHSCPHCQKYQLLYRREVKEKQQAEGKFRQIVGQLEEMAKQRDQLLKQLENYEELIQITNEAVEPYKNNVVLMQQHLEQIKKSIPVSSQQGNHLSEVNRRMERQLRQKKRTMDFQLNFLLKAHEREQQNNETKFSRVNFVIGMLENKIKELQAINSELAHQNKILNGIIHESSYVVQQRQLFLMASQQLYQMRMEYIKERSQRERLTRFVEKLKNKIYMLTSLIGYGVVSNIENNDLQEIVTLRQNIQKVSRVQERLTLDVFGVQSLKNYKSCYNEVKEHANQEDSWNCLYQSNFLVLFDDQEIQNGLEENITTIIKPDFFLLVRAILDSKYSQFLIEGTKANRFPEFAYAFIDFFRVKRNQNRIQVNLKRNGDEKDLMKNNFLLRIFDRKVGYLPEIATFRQFLIKNTPQDEVFYYLMCRNLIYSGPELNTYLGSSDPYNFVAYDKALSRTQQLLEHLDKNCKTIIFSHLNEKKIMKNRKLLIKANYVIRLLLQVYRKIKKEKISKLRMVFEQTSRITKTNYIKYNHFKQILRKNFPKLTNSLICEHYRKSMSIFHTHDQANFFQSFSASSMEYIMLLENLALNEQIKRRISAEVESQRCNYLMELTPDSIGQLGSQDLYQQYVGFIKLKGINIEDRVKICQFLLKVLNLRLYSVSNKEAQQKLSQPLDEINNKLIDIINQNFKKRQKYEQSLQKASFLIGKQFRKKIYQFYSQFVKDIKRQISDQNNQNS